MVTPVERLSDVFDLSKGTSLSPTEVYEEGASKISEKVEAKGPLTWHFVERKLTGVLARVLDINLEDCFLEAWQKLEELQAYRDADGAPEEIDIARHEVIYEIEQEIDVILDAVPIGQIDAKVTLKAVFDAIRLSVGKGRIWSVKPGAFSLSGSVSLNQNEVMNCEPGEYEFPMELKFRKGIPIPQALS